MYKATLVDFDNLTEEEKKFQPENGHGAESATYIKILHNNKVLSIESDAMEPEDSYFFRDLSWIPNALEKAYQLGYEDAKDEQ